MIVKFKNISITCTVDEFEELYTRGIFDAKTGVEALQELYNIPKEPIKTKPSFEAVALYGCQVSGDLKPYIKSDAIVDVKSSDLNEKNELSL